MKPTDRRLVALQNVPMEGPERIADLARARGLTVEVLEVFGPHQVPESLAPGDLLVVMGGGMGVGDLGDPRFPFLAREVALLQKALAPGPHGERPANPVLGVCLGAQLLAHAAGAAVYPATRRLLNGNVERIREVGWAPVRWTEETDDEPALRGLGPSTTVLHWHGDTFDLPPGAVHLASTERCQNQAFRMGTRCFGLQFHIELPPETVPRWLEEDAAFVALAEGPEGAQKILGDTARLGAEARRQGDRLIENILDCMLD
jgi:GMP synthase-like glutamine amidotransferase